MDKGQTSHPIAHRPLQLGAPVAFFVYMMLLIHGTFGGAVAPVVWWLVLLLPISAALAQFATHRILWRQASYVLSAAAMTVTGGIATNAVFAAIVPNGQTLVAAIPALSLILIAAWGYLLARKHVVIEGNRLETRSRMRSNREEESIVVPRRRLSIHNASRPVRILTISAVTYSAVKLMSYDIKTAVLGLAVWVFAAGGALLLGHLLYTLMLVRAWESKHGAPLLVGQNANPPDTAHPRQSRRE